MAALAAACAPARAQVGEPTQLLPGTAPQQGSPTQPTDPGASGAPASSGSIQVDPLDAAGTDYAGSLDSGGGGFGAGMWRGTDRVKVVRLLPLLRPTISPVLADLTRRLLLTNAAAPAGQGGGNLLALRARLLSDMGLAAEALALLRQLPADHLDADSARQLTELAWRTGDLDGGCSAALESLSHVEVDSFWKKATIFCQLRAGQTTEAELGLDVLHELGDNDEPFYALADLIGGATTAEISPLPQVTPLYLAMARAANVPLPKVTGAAPPPLMQALVAESPQAPLEMRLAAAETAAAVGLLSPRNLIAAYTAEPEAPSLLDTALDLPDLGTTPATRAILYQATVRAALPQLRAGFIQRALAAGPLDQSYWTALPLYAPLLAEMPASPDLTAFAAEAARHLYAAGYLREAGPWLATAAQAPTPAADLAGLQAVGYLASSGPAPLIDGLLPPATDPRGERLRALFAALDESLPPASDDTSASLSAGTAPAMPQQNLNLWLDLGDAAAKGRVGETVLLSLAGLAQAGLADAEPQWLFRIVKSLQRVGLEADARRLAVEAAITNGL